MSTPDLIAHIRGTSRYIDDMPDPAGLLHAAAVAKAPRRKLNRLGDRLMKAFAGDTTFAARLVDSVATDKATSETRTAVPPPIRPSSTTGSGIASPKITTVADVTATPIKANRVMKVGRPIAWPRI